MALADLPRTDRLLWGVMLVGTALAGLLAWLWLPPEKSGNILEQPSTFFNAPYGTKATYLVLERLQYPVSRLRRPLAPESLDQIGSLVILKPLISLQDHETTELESWIRRGHTLVVVPGRWVYETPSAAEKSTKKSESSGCCCPRGDCLDKWFCLTKEKEETDDSPWPKTVGAENLDGQMADSDPVCRGIERLTTAGKRRFAKSPLRGPLAKLPFDVFWKDKLGAVGLRVKLGKGTIFALADDYPLTNLGIGDADNGLLLVNLAHEARRLSDGKIAFDEFHQGFAGRDWSSVAMAKLMLVGPWRWAAAQAVAVGLLALYAGVVRFGGPRDVTRKPRRQQREFAEAAGRLLDEGGAGALALETLHRHYRERICRALHIEPSADDATVAQAVQDRSGMTVGPLLERARNAAAQKIGRQELLAITKRLHRVAETLDHGT